MADSLESTSLTFGRFNTRDYTKFTLIPEYSAETGAGRLKFRAGLTYDDTNRDDSAISPVAEIALQTSASVRVYGQYAESTQVPTYTALNSSSSAGLFRGNPDLGRETSRNLELGADFSVQQWTVQAAIFDRRDDDLVDWTYRHGVTARTANPVDIRTTGFELVAATHRARWDLVLGYTHLNKDADYGTAAVDASFYALNYAKHRLTAAIVARLGGGFEVRVDNEYRIQKESNLRTAGGDDAFLTGVGLYYLPQAWRGFELSFRVDNLWDSDFQEVPSVPAGRRQWTAGAAYHW
jgi:outer membrane cobalamin receptor